MTVFFEFLAYLVQVVFWWFIVQTVLSVLLRMRENKEENFRNMVQRVDEITHRVSVEKHGDTYYWFDVDDNEFLAQGKTTEETIEILKKRFPNHIFFLTTEDKKFKLHAPNWQLEPLNI